MATFKQLLGLGLTVVLLGIAGARLGFLHRVGASVQPVQPGHVGRTHDIARTEVAGMSLHSVRPNLDDALLSGATTSPMSEQ